MTTDPSQADPQTHPAPEYSEPEITPSLEPEPGAMPSGPQVVEPAEAPEPGSE